METLLKAFQKRATTAITKAFGGTLSTQEAQADVAPCAQEEFGHYQCNSALRLAKILKLAPKKLAEQIATLFEPGICSKIEIAGPGFINFVIAPEFLSKRLSAILHDARLGVEIPSPKKRIIVEFSSPNIAKELHVGHIRSTIIGDCLARLFEFLGQDVLRLNHLGDWGTQFGMLITYMKQVCPDVLEGTSSTDLSSLMQWYKAAKKRFDEDPLFKAKAQQEVVQLQAGNPEAMKAWKLICDISRKGFQQIYDLLGVKIIERGESFYNPFLKDVVEELENKGLVTLSEGAKCVYLEGFKSREGQPLPVMVQKSDGGYNYDTTDLAAIRHRIFVEKADRIIVVVDAGQSLHFQMIFALAQKAGWLNPQKVSAEHVGFGLVLGADGKKFKTRSGETEKLIDLLTEGVQKAKEILKEKHPEKPDDEIEKQAKIIGIDAIKYADLSCLRTKDYVFSYEKMLRFEGNTAIFLLYAYVRIQGIKRKVKTKVEEIVSHPIQLEHPTEISLAVHLCRFSEVLEIVAKDLLPNRLTDYLYELAEKFHAFFRDCRVEGDRNEKSRLLLCEITGRTLKKGLEILGLETLDRL